MIKNILRKIRRLLDIYNFHLLKTIYVNFRLFPIQQAIHLPFVIYNRTQIKISKSKINLEIPAKFGIIKWGFQNDWQVSKYSPSLLMMVNGEINILENIIIAPGVTIRIHEGNLTFGKNNFVGGQCKLLCNNNIKIGDNCMFAFGSIVADSDFHYIIHDGKIKNCNGEIIIGSGCWVGNNTTIMRGCILPDNTIVGSKSYVNKNFDGIEPYSILVGTPAKLIKTGYKKVPSELEGILREYFKKSKNKYCNSEIINNSLYGKY